MGIINNENILYLKVTCGVMRNKKKEIETGGYEGTMIGIREKIGEFEGQKTISIEVKMKDNKSDDIAIIQFTKESWFSIGFFSRIKKIDILKPFVIGVLKSDMNDKISFCYLKQQGIPKVESDKNFPKYEKVIISNKVVHDWTKPFIAMDNIIKEFQEKLETIQPKQYPIDADPNCKEEDHPSSAANQEENDLPF